MTTYVALLRAVNVGGRGNLKMEDLRSICVGAGLIDARTYIQSGNVVFSSDRSERSLVLELQRLIGDRMSRAVGVLIRTAAEMRDILDGNPFPDADESLVGVWFLPKALPERLLTALELGGPEDVRMIGREIYVHYPDGIGRSKMKIPFAADGTTRNLNTVAALVEMAGG
jgi:uncharacterized protein (DUF1697 family)